MIRAYCFLSRTAKLMMALIGRMMINEKMAQPNFVGPSVIISNNKIEINKLLGKMIIGTILSFIPS